MAVDVETYSIEGNDYLHCFEIAKVLEDRYVLYKQKYVLIRDPNTLTRLERIRHRSPTTTEVKHLDDYLLLDHLHGDYAIGVFAGPKATKFICVDVDINDADIVRKVIDTLAEMGIPRDKIYVSLSGGKGYHVDVLVKPMIWNEKAKLIYDEMIEKSGLDRRKVEFRATNKQAVKLPLGIHQKTKCRCWYVDRETLEPICDLNYIYETMPVDQALVEAIADRYSQEKIANIYNEMRKHKEKKARSAINAPPGFDITAPGTRHVMQCRYAIWLRRNGANRVELFNGQMAWYERQNKALISSMPDEVARDANDIADWCIRNVTVADGIADRQKAPSVEITQDDIALILSAPTPAYRRVVFYLLVYCKRYDSVKVAHRTIADKIGVSRQSVFAAVDWMCRDGMIEKGREFVNIGGCYVNTSNRYMFTCKRYECIPKRYQKAQTVVVDDWLTRETFDCVYGSVMSRMCTDSYLKKVMKPEEYKGLREANDSDDRKTDTRSTGVGTQAG